MAAVVAIVLVLLASLHASRAQFFPVSDGVNDLFSRLTFCNVQPRYPPINQYSCYRTNSARTSNGFTVCSPSFVRTRNASIAARTDNYTIYFLNSPGRLRGRNYPNRLLCKWNMRCPANQLMYMDVVEHDLEPAVRSPFFRDPICLDFLRLSRDFGDEVTCGRRAPMNNLEPSNLLIEFRTNRGVRAPGFRLRIVCFDPIQQDGVGCTVVPDDNSRRKRAKTVHNIVPPQPSPHDNITRVTIPVVTSVTFKRGLLKVSVHGENKTRTFNVRTLIVYQEQAPRFQKFGLSYKKVKFEAFGNLTIEGSVAYYWKTGVNERFMPNNAESRMIRKFLDAEEPFFVEEDVVIPECPWYIFYQFGSCNKVWKRSTPRRKERQAVSLPPEIVAAARTVQNACNAVLRSAAQSVLNFQP